MHVTLIALYVILTLELVLGLGLIAVGCILYCTIGVPMTSAVPSAGTRQVRNSNADGSLSSHDHRLSKGNAPLEGHRHLATSSFSTPVTIDYLNYVTFLYFRLQATTLLLCFILYCSTSCVFSIHLVQEQQ